MYKVVIFEDEIVIRKALISQIDWSSLECIVVAESSNGNEGMRIIENLRPDLIISDIRLHGCDAIDICKFINDKGYNMKVILMTGYAKMDYAQAAIKNGASDFILKPIDPNELMGAVRKCLNHLEQKEILENEILELKKISENELPRLRENFFREVYNNLITKEIEIKRRCQFLNIKLEQFRCIAIDIDINNDVPDEMIRKKNELLYQIKDVIIQENSLKAIYTFMWQGKLYLIFNESEIILETFVDEIQSLAFNKFSLSISVGISNSYEEVINLSDGLKESEHALSYKFHKGNGSVIWADSIHNIPKNEIGSNAYLMNQYMMIANNVIAGKGMEAKKSFVKFWEELSEVNNELILRNKAIELLVVLAYHLKNKNFDIEQLIPLNLMHEKIKKLSDLHSIYMLLSNLIFLLSKQRQEELADRGSNVIECIKEYIDKNYDKSISLSNLADKVFLSEKYLSALVKKETGQTITDLITEKRIAIAKELLKDTQLKTYEISMQIGINDSRYFSQLFKKHTGYTPSQYRRYQD